MISKCCEHVISVRLSQAFACTVLLTWPKIKFFSHVGLFILDTWVVVLGKSPSSPSFPQVSERNTHIFPSCCNIFHEIESLSATGKIKLFDYDKLIAEYFIPSPAWVENISSTASMSPYSTPSILSSSRACNYWEKTSHRGLTNNAQKNYRRNLCWFSEGSGAEDPTTLTWSCSLAAGALQRLTQLLRR